VTQYPYLRTDFNERSSGGWEICMLRLSHEARRTELCKAWLHAGCISTPGKDLWANIPMPTTGLLSGLVLQVPFEIRSTSYGLGRWIARSWLLILSLRQDKVWNECARILRLRPFPTSRILPSTCYLLHTISRFKPALGPQEGRKVRVRPYSSMKYEVFRGSRQIP
jgi:hypothetical protein